MERLSRSFFDRSTIQVAQELLGKMLVFDDYKGVITETEAYIGKDDPACHAAKGRTKRTDVMFGPAGFSYVYFIYGMYHCLNFVTEKDGFPAAVLIRGINLIEPEQKKLGGPGKLCRHLGITREHNRIDITQSDSMYVLDTLHRPTFNTTSRIGISVGQEHPWRFVID